jgi:hypothetical protein
MSLRLGTNPEVVHAQRSHLNFDALVVLRRVQEIELAKKATRKSISRGIDGKNAASA